MITLQNDYHGPFFLVLMTFAYKGILNEIFNNLLLKILICILIFMTFFMLIFLNNYEFFVM
jgi:hypothetical protein